MSFSSRNMRKRMRRTMRAMRASGSLERLTSTALTEGPGPWHPDQHERLRAGGGLLDDVTQQEVHATDDEAAIVEPIPVGLCALVVTSTALRPQLDEELQHVEGEKALRIDSKDFQTRFEPGLNLSDVPRRALRIQIRAKTHDQSIGNDHGNRDEVEDRRL